MKRSISTVEIDSVDRSARKEPAGDGVARNSGYLEVHRDTGPAAHPRSGN
jgi:hypothetical protein